MPLAESDAKYTDNAQLGVSPQGALSSSPGNGKKSKKKAKKASKKDVEEALSIPKRTSPAYVQPEIDLLDDVDLSDPTAMIIDHGHQNAVEEELESQPVLESEVPHTKHEEVGMTEDLKSYDQETDQLVTVDERQREELPTKQIYEREEEVQLPSRPRPIQSAQSDYNRGEHVRKSSFNTQRPSLMSNARRESMNRPVSTRAPSSIFNAAPPYMYQQHFFSAPDLGFNLSGDATMTETTEISCYRFDTFASSGCQVSASLARHALLVGCRGGLDIYRVMVDKMEVIGRLEGLRGQVLDAKILPVSTVQDRLTLDRPLIVLVIHGPVGTDGSSRPTEYGKSKKWQTTVEVYSLRSQARVAVLYEGIVTTEESTAPPKSVGNLEVDCRGSNISIASGTSGEIFLFRHNTQTTKVGESFSFLGKYWTALQTRSDQEQRSTTDSKQSEIGGSSRPLMGLGRRWLYLVSPASASTVAIGGMPALSDSWQPPGWNTHAPPMQPILTAEVVEADEEGVISKASRQAAQELLKASRKGLELGLAGWREFTNPSKPSTSTPHARSTSESAFPPTHAPPHDPHRSVQEPAIVSLVDLDQLGKTEQIKSHPSFSASFALESGCNFMALSCDGLKLLTVDRKGEQSSIWNLKSVLHATQGTSVHTDIGSPCVTLLQKITRNSPSVVVEAVWSRDDDWLAMQTTHGTIHLHHILSTQQRGSPKRSRTVNGASNSNKSGATVSVSQGLSPPSSGFLSSFKSGWQNVSTQVGALRSASTTQPFGIPTTFAGLKDTANAARMASSRVVARGLSQGYSAAKTGMGDIWHAEDNKIRHKDLSHRSSLHWIKNQDGASLGFVCGRSVFLHPIRKVIRQRGDEAMFVLKVERGGRREFSLPAFTSSNQANCARQGPHGFWSLSSNDHRPSQQKQEIIQRTDEVESNPVFCPFHVDTRVSMLAFREGTQDDGSELWCFGDSLPPSHKVNDNTTTSSYYDSHNDTGNLPDAMIQSRTLINKQTGDIDITMRPKDLAAGVVEGVLTDDDYDGHDNEGFDHEIHDDAETLL